MAGILESTVYLSVTAVIILLFKWIFKNKLSAKWHVWIWALLAIRLVLPSLPESSLSVFNAIEMPLESRGANTAQQMTEIVEPAPEILQNETVMLDEFSEMKNEVVSVEKTENAVADTEVHLADEKRAEAQNGTAVENTKEPVEISHAEPTVPEEKENASFDTETVVKTVRYTGAVLLFAYFAVIYAVCIVRLSKKPKLCDSKTAEMLKECKKKVGVRRKVSVICDGNSPMLAGLFKPVIVLPDGYSEKENRDIFIHELCHLKNGDIYILWIAMIVLCLNWYNPIMWICFFIFRRDIEVYCDERVLRYIDSKKDYAALLVKTALKKNSFIAGTTSLQNGEKEVERRVKYMAYFKKPHYTWTVIIVIIAVIIGVVCLTDPKRSRDDSAGREDEVLQKSDDGEKQTQPKSMEDKSEDTSLLSEDEFSVTYNGFTFDLDTTVEEITSYFPTSDRWEEPQNYVFIAGCPMAYSIGLYYPSYHEPDISLVCIENVETGESFIQHMTVYKERVVTVVGRKETADINGNAVYVFNPDSPESHSIDLYQKSLVGEKVSALPIDSEIELLYASGAGAWGDYLHIKPDGNFWGEYHDSNVGDFDENKYPNGTVYIDRYEGKYGDFVKLDDYTYLLTVLWEEHEFKPGAEWIEEGIRYISTSPEKNDVGNLYVLCLPGKPTAEIPRAVLEWGRGGVSAEKTTLPDYCYYSAWYSDIGYFGYHSVYEEPENTATEPAVTVPEPEPQPTFVPVEIKTETKIPERVVEPVREVIPAVVENNVSPVMLYNPETAKTETKETFDTEQPTIIEEKAADEQTEPAAELLENEISISYELMW